MAALDQVGDYGAKSDKKLTEDAGVISRIFNTAKKNESFKESKAYKSLKKKLPHFGYDSDEMRDPADAAQALAVLLTDPENKKAVNLKSTLDVMIKTAGNNLPQLMEQLQKVISPQTLHSVTSGLKSKPYAALMDTIGKGMIVAEEVMAKK